MSSVGVELLLVDEGVEQGGLAGLEAQVVLVGLAHVGEQAVLGEPVLGEQALGAVVELDHRAALPHGLEDLRQRDLLLRAVLVLVRDAAAELEPVDAAGDGQRGRAAGTHHLLVGGDAPAAGQQHAHQVRDVLAGDDQGVLLARSGRTQAQAGGLLDRLALHAEVAADEAALAVLAGAGGLRRCERGGVGGLVGVEVVVFVGLGGFLGDGGVGGDGHEAAGAGGGDPQPAVVEVDPRGEGGLAGGAQFLGLDGSGAEQLEHGPRVDALLGVAEVVGQVQLGQLGQEVEPLDEALDLVVGHAHAAADVVAHPLDLRLLLVAGVAELLDPRGGLVVVQRGGPGDVEAGAGEGRVLGLVGVLLEDHKAVGAAQREQRGGDGDAAAGAAELEVQPQLAVAGAAGEPGDPGGGAARHRGPFVFRGVLALGPRALVPADLAEARDVAALVELDEAAAGVDHPAQQRTLRPGREAEGALGGGALADAGSVADRPRRRGWRR